VLDPHGLPGGALRGHDVDQGLTDDQHVVHSASSCRPRF
jgi:hypothetical protein